MHRWSLESFKSFSLLPKNKPLYFVRQCVKGTDVCRVILRDTVERFFVCVCEEMLYFRRRER